jgi:hypothetical protein
MRYLPIFAIWMLTACASAVGTTGTSNVRLIDQKEASHCKYIGDAHGTSPFYGVFAGPAMDSARSAAMTKAAEMGGNAVLWKANETGYGSTSVHADVYRCR